MKKLKVAYLPAICAASLCLSAQAQDWEIELSPYIFGTNLNGDTGAGHVLAEVDMSFGDIVDVLDSALMGTFVASNGTWSILGDAFYAKLQDEEAKSWQGPGGIGSLTGDLEVTLTQEIYQLAVAYRLGDEETNVDIFGGARYTQLDNELDLVFTSGGLLPGGVTEVGGSESWLEPILGARFLTPMGNNWSFLTYVDYAFGSGDSDGGYQAILGFNWQTGKTWNTKFGYRYLSWDFQDEDTGYVWDMVMDGLYVGVGFQF